MNTVAKGDNFENISYELIIDSINNLELGILPANAKVFRKKGYYSKDREKDIIFDLSIEIWLKDAERYSNLYLIECKSSTKKNIPVDDVEEFFSKIRQISDTNVKGIMITDKSFQKGGFTYAKNKNLMLIEVNGTSKKIILHKTSKNNEIVENISLDEKIQKFVNKTLAVNKIEGLKFLSAVQIEEIANKIHYEYKGISKPINKDDFLEYLKSKYNLNFNFKSGNTIYSEKTLGCYLKKEKTIYINLDKIETSQFTYILGHELGHFFLHNDLIFNQQIYDDFEDTKYSFKEDKHLLVNDRNWIEWQANKFSISLFLPKDAFIYHFNTFRKEIGISRYSHIYLDNQDINQIDYKRTVDYLSNLFGISKTTIKYRIQELELITFAENQYTVRDIVRREFF